MRIPVSKQNVVKQSVTTSIDAAYMATKKAGPSRDRLLCIGSGGALIELYADRDWAFPTSGLTYALTDTGHSAAVARPADNS